MKTKKMFADVLDLPADEKLEIRLPKILKDALIKESKQKGYPKLSRYVLNIIINRD